jgi:hypothetical protein
MNVLNKSFSKIYIISSYATQNRLNDLLPFLNDENISYELVISPKKKYFKDAVDDNSLMEMGSYSLLSVNESIFLKESYIKSDSFLIFEDDVSFDMNYIEKLKLFINQIPKNWDIINVGYHAHNNHLHSKFSEFDNIYNLQDKEEIVGTHAVAYKNNTVNFILNSIETSIYPLDWFLSKNVYPNFNVYIPVDKIFYASSYRNYETDKNEFYKKYKSEIG